MNSMSDKLKVIIFGATGLAGSGVLDACLDDPKVEKVTAILRKNTGRKSSKLKEVIHTDYLDYTAIEDDLKDHNACFWCLGISQSQTKDEAIYKKISREFTLAGAEILSRLNKEMTFIYISGAGTNIDGRMMWARVKGETEKELGSYGFKANYNFRPAMIYSTNEYRHSLWAYRMFALLVPITKRLVPSQHISSFEVGKAMINVTLRGSDKNILENRDLLAFR